MCPSALSQGLPGCCLPQCRPLRAAPPAQAPLSSSTLNAQPPAPVPQHAPALAPQASPSSAPLWGQCGGAGSTCPLANKTLCVDAAYRACSGANVTCYRCVPPLLYHSALGVFSMRAKPLLLPVLGNSWVSL
jgi:hypothetical protein